MDRETQAAKTISRTDSHIYEKPTFWPSRPSIPGVTSISQASSAGDVGTAGPRGRLARALAASADPSDPNLSALRPPPNEEAEQPSQEDLIFKAVDTRGDSTQATGTVMLHPPRRPRRIHRGRSCRGRERR